MEIAPNDEKGTIKTALDDFNKPLALDPNDLFLLKGRRFVYYWLNQHDDSLIDLNKFLEVEPNDAWALKQRGDVYFKLGTMKMRWTIS